MLSTFIRLRPSQTAPYAPSLPSYRIESIDFLRGLVMIIMALDHTREFIHQEGLSGDPLDLATTTPWIFLTRWITHFCAPVFVFLAGTSIYFQSLRKSKKALSRFLLTRGLWLIVAELTLIAFALTFDVTFSFLILQVIWAIGISMILLAAAIWLPLYALLAAGLLIVLGHNSLDYYEAGKENFHPLYSLLHRPAFIPIGETRVLGILYPFLPWTGLMLLGFCFGRLFTLYEGAARKKVLLALGAGIVLCFIALRATNAYGDPSPWVAQPNVLYTFFSFINTSKYPPSLLYLSMTIGPAIIFLAFFSEVKSRFAKIVTVFGKVPFFYYILHFYLIHLISSLLFLSRGHSVAEGAAGVPEVPFKFIIPGEGYSMAVTYFVWLAVVAILYPACQWYSGYKQTHKAWWLSYL